MLIVNLIRFGRKELYKLVVPYDVEFLDKIKQLSSDQRNWDAPSKSWWLTAIGIYNLILQYKGRTADIAFKFENDKQKELFNGLIKKHKARLTKKAEKLANLAEFNAKILQMKDQLVELTKDFDYSKFLREGIVPMPHQIQGAYFANILAQAEESTLLAMDLGTGKSLTSILAAQMDVTVKKCLFIVPASLRLNIQAEVEKFTYENCFVVKTIKDKKTGEFRYTKYNRNKGKEFHECKFVVISYDYFSSKVFDANAKVLALGLSDVDLIVFDEGHYISNKHSNRSINIKKSFDGVVDKRIALTATPVKNNVTNFFPLLKMLKPDMFSSESTFFTKYCGLRYSQCLPSGYPGWEQTGETNFEGLYFDIQTFTFRVKKEDVLKDLPPIMINKIVLEMSDEETKEYKQIAEGFKKVDWTKGALTKTDINDSDAPIVILTRLRMYTASLKVKKALELIRELNDNGEKVILFDAFKKPIYDLEKLLGKESKIYTGDQTSEQKQDLVVKFQDKNSDLMNLLISLQAGNAGITLTEAKNVIQTTLSYVPSENSQAYGRAHRIGQLFQVMVYILIMADTIDEVIYEVNQEKEKIIKAVVDGEEHVEDAEVSALSEIFKKIKEMYE